MTIESKKSRVACDINSAKSKWEIDLDLTGDPECNMAQMAILSGQDSHFHYGSIGMECCVNNTETWSRQAHHGGAHRRRIVIDFSVDRMLALTDFLLFFRPFRERASG